jgi:hypothetical protein
MSFGPHRTTFSPGLSPHAGYDFLEKSGDLNRNSAKF